MRRQLLTAVRMLFMLTLLLGVAYPAAILAVGLLVPGRANGSPVTVAGRTVGSALLGQAFDQPRYFWGRPSASGYDAMASGGTNYGPNNQTYAQTVAKRISEIAAANHVTAREVPADAVTASGSGLDPHISPAYAAIQVARVAAARHIDPGVVRGLVAANTTGRALGFLGEPVVNVVTLNAALDQLPDGP